MDDPVLLSRIQFAITVGFHFLFPPISIGLAWCLVVVEWQAWRTKDPHWRDAGRLFARILALTFAVGVATGIVMEFQFGTNWAEYSKFVGDIFGAPLAAEALFAFFLESAFLGLYLFGRNKVGPGLIWFSVLMVAVGATISAFWILAANSWQQTPAGFIINETTGRAELSDFMAAVFNPSTMPRFYHTMMASLVCGSFFMAGLAGYRLRRDANNEADRKALKVAVIIGLLASIAVAFPTGHVHAQQVAATQPTKFAAIEGLYESEKGAPLVAFGLVKDDPPDLKARIDLPIEGLLSWLAFGDAEAEILGINHFREKGVGTPPLWLTFVSFHNMVILGVIFQLAMVLAMIQLIRKKLWTSRRLLLAILILVPFTLAACQFGWVAAEVGRQPWVVYPSLTLDEWTNLPAAELQAKVAEMSLLTERAASQSVTAGEVLFSITLFTAIYLALLALYLFLLFRETKHGVAPLEPGSTDASDPHGKAVSQ